MGEEALYWGESCDENFVLGLQKYSNKQTQSELGSSLVVLLTLALSAVREGG